MNRRAFLSILTAGLAAAADPERLLWVPGRKVISIPKLRKVLFEPGDVFTIAGRYVINPITRQEAIYRDPMTGQRMRFLQKFVSPHRVLEGDSCVIGYPAQHMPSISADSELIRLYDGRCVEVID